jgi:hypothetical protein
MDEEKQVKEPPVTYDPTLGSSRENVPVPQPAQRELGMLSTAVATVIKMIESLPEVAQDQVVEHLQEYIQDLRDESLWDVSFKKTQPQLMAAARRARQEIAGGQAKPLDLNQL